MITTLAERATALHEVQRSRFIARATRIESATQAQAFVAEVSEAKANHNCWAWRLADAHRYSDDGEPGGAAGRPILQAIEGAELDQVVVVVTRYFGGIRLGMGGMIRAYHGAAAACLREAPRLELHPEIELELKVPFQDVGVAWRLLERFEASRREERYDADGLSLRFRLQQRRAQALRDELREASAGRAQLRKPADS